MAGRALGQREIRRLFKLLDQELAAIGIQGEIYLMGGAVMCLAYDARPATQDVDAVFRPVRQLREAAARVAERAGVSNAWLNDGVKGFMSDRAEFAPFLEFSHLRVLVAQPEYLLAMKCIAMRIGAEFHDEDDVRFLLRWLNVESVEQTTRIIERFYPLERIPQKTLYALAEILAPASDRA
ncbi:hypothetical protein K2X89_00260 [Myxococcota bacterium]|nr:hypothetical protein [Myxococcota bacterium]